VLRTGQLTPKGFSESLTTSPRFRNIVLVHGAFVDGSGWKLVYDILVKAPITSANVN
jgi:hypothetical protein